MSVTVTLIGAQDRSLEARLRSAGMRPTVTALADLATLTHPLSTPTDVVVLDLRAEQQIPSALSLLRRRHPQTDVIVVTSSLDSAFLLEAMRSGVTECVTGATEGDLEAAIARCLAQRVVPEFGEAFAFVGAKGGVGATTVAVHIARALATLGSAGRTLFIDLHPAGGDAALYCGVDPHGSVIDALEHAHRLDASSFRGLVDRTDSGFDLLGSANCAGAAPVDLMQVRALIDFAVRQYRYVVLDIPHGDTAILNSLGAARSISIVVNHELGTIRNAGRLANLLRERYGKDKITVVLNQSDRDAEIGVEQVERGVGSPIAHVFPSDGPLALRASRGDGRVVADAGSPLAHAFQTYGRALAGVIEEGLMPPRQNAGFLGRLTGRRSEVPAQLSPIVCNS